MRTGPGEGTDGGMKMELDSIPRGRRKQEQDTAWDLAGDPRLGTRGTQKASSLPTVQASGSLSPWESLTCSGHGRWGDRVLHLKHELVSVAFVVRFGWTERITQFTHLLPCAASTYWAPTMCQALFQVLAVMGWVGQRPHTVFMFWQILKFWYMYLLWNDYHNKVS